MAVLPLYLLPPRLLNICRKGFEMKIAPENSSPEPTNYHAYLLRLWRDGSQQPWRASLHCSTTDVLHHFADVSHLIAFLQDQMGEGNAPDEIA
jgi:hypothetical protein